MKKKIILSLILTILYIFIASFVFATEEELFPQDSILTKGSNAISSLFNGLLGLLLYGLTFPIVVSIFVAYAIYSVLLGVPGQILTPDDIFLNRLTITDINIYINPTLASSAGLSGLANSISTWFRIIFLLAIALQFIALIYLAIKAMIASLASEKAVIKEMLVNWAKSVVLLFAMMFIIVAIIQLSTAFVNSIGKTVADSGYLDSSVAKLFGYALWPTFTTQVAAIALIIALFAQSLSFLYAYLKRMVNVGFLIIIAPLIAVSYSIDKLGNNKSETLSGWLRDFTQKVMMQPVHLLLYVILMNATLSTMSQTSGFSIVSFLLILIIFKFIAEAEGIVQSMFQLSSGTKMNEGSELTNMLLGTALIKKAGEVMSVEDEEEKKSTTSFAGKNMSPLKNNTNVNITQPAPNNSVNAGGTPNSKGVNNTQLTQAQNALNKTVRKVVAPQQADANAQGTLGGQPQGSKPTAKRKLPAQAAKSNTMIGKFKSKTGVVGSSLLRQLNTPKGRALIAKAGLGTLGAVTGYAVASNTNFLGEMAAGAGVGWISGGKVAKGIEERRKRAKLKGTVKEDISKAASEASTRTQQMSQLNGKDMSNETEEGRRNMLAMFEEVRERMSDGSLMKEHGQLLDEYVRYLRNAKDISLRQAHLEAQKLMHEISSGSKDLSLMEDGIEKDFAENVVQMSMAQEIAEFDRKYGSIGVSFEDDVEIEAIDPTVGIPYNIGPEGSGPENKDGNTPPEHTPPQPPINMENTQEIPTVSVDDIDEIKGVEENLEKAEEEAKKAKKTTEKFDSTITEIETKEKKAKKEATENSEPVKKESTLSFEGSSIKTTPEPPKSADEKKDSSTKEDGDGGKLNK